MNGPDEMIKKKEKTLTNLAKFKVAVDKCLSMSPFQLGYPGSTLLKISNCSLQIRFIFSWCSLPTPAIKISHWFKVHDWISLGTNDFS